MEILMKIRNIILSAVFVSVLITMMGWNIHHGVLYSRGMLERDYTMNWAEPKQSDIKSVSYIEKTKTYIENIINNYMPYYSELLVANRDINYSMDYRLYSMIYKDSDNWFVPVGKDDYDFKFESGDHTTLVNMYSLDSKYIRPNFEAAKSFFTSLAGSDADVNLYVYSCNVFDNSKLAEQTNLYVGGREDYVLELQEAVRASGADMDYLKYNTMDEYRDYFYKTDHHWTILGAYQGYCDIINMIRKNSPEINEPRIAEEVFEVEGVQFRGSIARISAFDNISDKIYDMRFELPDYSYTVDGYPPYDGYTRREEYLSGDYDKSVFANAYAEYFHTDCGTTVYDFGNNTGRNLLAFIDSFSNCIDPVLASHYDKTYLIDLRYSPYDTQTFDYKQFIEDNDIDDVLFMMYSDTLLYDNYPGNYKNKIVNY